MPVTNAAKRREIPAKSIVGSNAPAFEKAIDKEWSSWSKHQAVDIIMPEEARKVQKDKISTSRFVFTDRYHAKRIAGEAAAALEARARMVVRGFQESDLLSFRRDAPTTSQLSQRWVCIVVVAKQWKLRGADVESAYFQGEEIQR